MTQRVAGVVDAGALEPARTRHARAFLEDATMRRRRLHFEAFPQGLPELLEVLHGPAPQRLVVLQIQAAAGVQPVAQGPRVRLHSLSPAVAFPDSMQPYHRLPYRF